MLNRQPIKISGIGRYLPKRIVTNHEIEAMCNLSSGWVQKYNGVLQRHWADPVEETNSFMGAAAAREAVADAGLELTEISCIINASGTREQTLPDGGALLQKALGLESSGIPCLSINTTCLSFISALQTAVGLFATHAYEHILIVSSELGSVALNFEEKESATLVGDGAGAILLSRNSEEDQSCIETARFETYALGAAMTEVRGGGSRRHPNHADTLPTDNLFHMNGPAILRTVRKISRGFLDRLQPGLSEGLEDIDFVIPHQASLVGLRMLRFFNWPESKIAITLPQFGNCVAASIPMALYEMVKEGRVTRGDRLLLVGTGAGLSIGGVILVY